MTPRLLLAAVSLLALSAPALADDGARSPWQIGARLLAVLPQEDATVTPIGGNAQIDEAYVPELNFTYFINESWSVELIAATAPHEVKHTPTDLNLGEVWLLPPTLLIQYHFMPESDSFRPYVGAGINYTIFYNVNDEAPGISVDYEDSFGFALQAGFDIPLDEHWSFNLDVKQIFLNTEVNIAPLGVRADVDIDPIIVGVGLRYRFD